MGNPPVIVITGATNGLGRLAALELARRGAQLGIVARSPDKVDELRGEIESVAPGTAIDSFLADLTSLGDVRRVGQEIGARYDSIDVLINNAGVHAFSQRITDDGFSEMVAVNYLAPWLLTSTLLNKLVASAPARIVTTASAAAQHARSIDPARDLTLTAEYTRRESGILYGRTKLMDMMFSLELGRRLAGTGVTVNCCDPGFNTTGLGRDLPFAGILERALTALHVGDPRRGAGIIVRLATDPAFAESADGYYSVKSERPIDCPEYGRSKEIQAQLWDATSAVLERQ
ncbi:MAG: Short-chain dehydrogenase [Nocardia sp.]|uniref:SDR family NAD(P)-dependent oxidoreductase n=1 Tax=Nocardia sp. TaxID=1821 RepID=UPI00262F4A9A|nr:SDR family NAD(P)-dependent oxidoreductase [Nocardia sp.]MCU1644146.1 Short-chain dehydrogenase [Nocardia sp.]